MRNYLPSGVLFMSPKEEELDEYRKKFPGSVYASEIQCQEFDTKGPCLHKMYLLSTDMLPNELFSNSLLRQSLRRAFSNSKMSFTERILVAGRSWSLVSPISHKDRCCQLGPMDKEIEEVRHQHFFCNSCCISNQYLSFYNTDILRISQYLYHEKQHFKSCGGAAAGIIIRRALMESKSQWQSDELGEPIYFTSASGDGPYRENLIRDHPVLGTRLGRNVCIETGRHGYVQFEKARACHTGDDHKSFWQT